MAEIKDGRVFVDPTQFNESDLPLICLSDDRNGFIGWGIKAHEHGNYPHSFILHRKGFAVSQGFSTFKEINISDYMKPNQLLKFWRIKNLTEAEKNMIYAAVTRRLALPWIKKTYDWLGIFGQFLHLNFIQNPWQTFCSEQVRIDYISEIHRASALTPKQPSPSDLDRIFKANPEVFECVGYYFED